ncbi:MAG: NAD-dependent epimerase/dehydratase family protein [Nannocystales bacterium]
MNVLVAGASGFIGTEVVAALLRAGHEVVAVSRTRGTLPLEVVHVSADVGAAPIGPAGFEGVDAVVNLVGIAVERGANTFEAAHIRAVEHLLQLSETLGVKRFVHISVVRPDGSDGAYHRTKRAGEARVTSSDRDWTLLRPGLVYGPGDAMLSNLVRFVTLAPVFVAPAGPTGPLQTVDVEDVAAAVVRTLATSSTHGATIDVVGPDRVDLPELVRTVGAALGLPTWVTRMPGSLMRLAAGVMQRTLPNPPITPTQLGMLVDGLYGEHEHSREHLGLTPRALSTDRIREVAQTLDAPSLRLLPSAADRTDAQQWAVPLWFPVLALAALLLGPWLIEDLWLRMLAIEGGLVAALLAAKAPIRSWMRLSPRDLGVGVAAGLVMVAGALGVTAGLQLVAPELMADASEVYGWATTWSRPATVLMLLVIAGAEDLVWRFAITLGLVQRLGPAGAVFVGGLAFAVAHATTGPPILVLAALLAGMLWSALAIRTRAWLAVVTCHVLWDASMVIVAP